MDISFLLQVFLGLVVLLGILLYFLIYLPKQLKSKEKKIKKYIHHKKTDFRSLHDLTKVIKNKSSTTKELKEALDLIIKHHGTIHKKLGIRSHPDFDIYAEVIMRICRHPNTTKDLIVNFDRELEDKNKEYKREINDFLTKGLNSRGF